MPTTYSPNLKLTLIGDGEQAGTWGQITNANLGTLLEQAISYFTDVPITDAAGGYFLTTTAGVVNQARSMGVDITSAVTLSATRNVYCPATPKLYAVRNSTTGGQSIVFRAANTSGTAGTGAGITIPNGGTAIVLCTGVGTNPDVIDPFTSKVSKTGDTMSGQLNITATNNTPYSTAGVSVNIRNTSTTNNTYSGLALDNAASNTGALLFSEYVGTNASRFAIATNPGTSPTALSSRFTINSDGSFSFLNNSAQTTVNFGAASINIGNGTAGEKQLYLHNSTRLCYLYIDGSGNLGLYDGTSANSRWVTDNAGNFTATGNVTAYSDSREKTDLHRIADALEKVCSLTGYTYTRTDTGAKQTGLIAQDVQKVLPEAVLEGERLSLAYGNMMGLMVEAVKELTARVKALESA